MDFDAFVNIIRAGDWCWFVGTRTKATAAFSAQKKLKEISIHKVLGATVTSVTIMLSKDYIKLIIIASGIAIPVTWYVMSGWLENFAYHISIRWWMYVVAGMIAMLIALITVSFMAIKAALTSPVRSLRTELRQSVKLPQVYRQSAYLMTENFRNVLYYYNI